MDKVEIGLFVAVIVILIATIALIVYVYVSKPAHQALQAANAALGQVLSPFEQAPSIERKPVVLFHNAKTGTGQAFGSRTSDDSELPDSGAAMFRDKKDKNDSQMKLWTQYVPDDTAAAASFATGSSIINMRVSVAGTLGFPKVLEAQESAFRDENSQNTVFIPIEVTLLYDDDASVRAVETTMAVAVYSFEGGAFFNGTWSHIIDPIWLSRPVKAIKINLEPNQGSRSQKTLSWSYGFWPYQEWQNVSFTASIKQEPASWNFLTYNNQQ